MKIFSVDAGNTHLRTAFADLDLINHQLEIVHTSFDRCESAFRELFERFGFDLPIAVSSVVEAASRTLPDLFRKAGHTGQVIFCDHRECSLLDNRYSETLGIDRYADAAAALCRFPENDLIIIDSGTAAKVDFVQSKGRIFLGGFILPGIGLKTRIIHEGTDRLPLLDPYKLTLAPIPVTTEEAVSGGLLLDTAGGIEKAVMYGKKILNNPIIAACGGGWEIVKSYVDIDAVDMPDLTLLGTALVGAEHIQRGTK